MSGTALAKAAHELVGCPFRLHGRDPATGIDCLGLVLLALDRIGRPARLGGDYAMRMQSITALARQAGGLGFSAAVGPWLAGDVVLFTPGLHQHHLAIADGPTLLIHAHAGLGRVVVSPPSPEWECIGLWRLTQIERK